MQAQLRMHRKRLAGIGGGAYFDASTAKLRDCLFETNRAEGSDLFGQLASFGGGLATRGPSMVTTIRQAKLNREAGRGGGGEGIPCTPGVSRETFSSSCCTFVGYSTTLLNIQS